MQSKKQRKPWQIKVHAKAKLLDIKFKGTNNTLPTSNSKSSPFPINLKLNLNFHPSLLQFKKSEPQPSVPGERKSMKSKFLRVVGKIRHRPSKNIPSSAAKLIPNLGHPEPHFPVNQPRHLAYEEPMFVSSIVIGFTALLSQLISQKDQKEIILCSLIILMFLASTFKKLIKIRFIRTRNVLVIVIVAMLSCAIGVYLGNNLKISEGYVSDCFWNALDYVLKLCSLFAQEIHSRFSQYVGDEGGDNHLGNLTF